MTSVEPTLSNELIDTLWRDAHEILGRHGGPDVAGACHWCHHRWPCPPHRLAERVCTAVIAARASVTAAPGAAGRGAGDRARASAGRWGGVQAAGERPNEGPFTRPAPARAVSAPEYHRHDAPATVPRQGHRRPQD